MKFSANNKSVLGLIIISAIILTSGYAVNQLVVDLNENQKSVQHTYLVINKVASISSFMQDIEKGSNAYVITKNQNFLQYYDTAVMNVHTTINELKDLETYKPVKQKILDLENLIEQKIETMNKDIDLINTEKTNQFVENISIAKGRQLTDEISQIIKEIENTEYILLYDRSNESQQSFSNLSNLSIISSTIIICIVIIVYVILDKGSKEKTKQERKQQAEYTDTKEKQQAKYTDTKEKQQLEYTDTKEKQQLEYTDTKAKQQAKYTDTKEKQQAKYIDTKAKQQAKYTDTKEKTHQEQKQQLEYTDTKAKQQAEYIDTKAKQQLEYANTQEKQQLEYTDTKAKQQAEYIDTKAKQQVEYTDEKEKNFNQKPNIIDVLLSRKEADIIVNSATMIKNVQNRINKALENGYEYTGTINSSEKFLRKNVFQKINMAVLYVDLVGSTKMSAELSSDKLSTLISSFSQEMAYVINAHHGYVLKFVGDAVIGYFVENETSSFQTVDNAVGCAESMMNVVNQGINPILIEKAGLSEISIKIGIDFGKNVIVRYGSDKKMAYVDLLGPTMNLVSKIQGLAKPNQILVGQEIHDRLHPSIQEFFLDITNELADKWQHSLKNSEQVYRVYRYKYE